MSFFWFHYRWFAPRKSTSEISSTVTLKEESPKTTIRKNKLEHGESQETITFEESLQTIANQDVGEGEDMGLLPKKFLELAIGDHKNEKDSHSIVGVEATIAPPIAKAMIMYELDLVGIVVEHEALLMEQSKETLGKQGFVEIVALEKHVNKEQIEPDGMAKTIALEK